MTTREAYEAIRRETAKACFARFCADNMCVRPENRALADDVGAILTEVRDHIAVGDEERAQEAISRARAILAAATAGLDVRETILRHVEEAK